MRSFLTILMALVLLPAAAYAKADGKVTILPPTRDYSKSVIIDNGRQKLIIRTDEDSAARLQKILKKKGRVIIRNRNGTTTYPDDYYPYYRKKDPAYSVGRALGTRLKD
jgi:hypothetical protein